METQEFIRNFAIIAHVDHGKSTLADRLLELTGTIASREMRAQFLDSLALERERGITIKLKAVRMGYDLEDHHYQLNMIDTPGHVDFGYEVSRSIVACEGVILVVDATQGVQAQTVSNIYKALENGLTVVPFINKIDLPIAQPEQTAQELINTFGFVRENLIFGSAKTGTGVPELLAALIKKIPPPGGTRESRLRALIFDSAFDEYKGVIAYVRVVDGKINLKDFSGSNHKLKFLATEAAFSPIELGFFKPQMEPKGDLLAGEVGYVATGLKEIRQVRVGDTLAEEAGETLPLPGYKEPKPMVFLGLYPTEGTNFMKLRFGIEKLRLTDGSLSCSPEGGGALGMGFRCGFLGLLHADIVQERLERDYGLNLITTTPSVSYEVLLSNGSVLNLKRASDLPDMSTVRQILEPYVNLYIFTPGEFSGSILKFSESYRAKFINMEYLGRVVKLTFEAPLSELISDFYDRLKSISSGFASLDYELIGFREGDLCRLDFIIADEIVPPLSLIVPKDKAYAIGSQILIKLKETIDRHQFVVVLQASIGGRIIARQEIPSMRKNVLAKMSGGHRERKDKLLEKQKKGKKRLRKLGRVEIPQEAFRIVLERV